MNDFATATLGIALGLLLLATLAGLCWDFRHRRRPARNVLLDPAAQRRAAADLRYFNEVGDPSNA